MVRLFALSLIASLGLIAPFGFLSAPIAQAADIIPAKTLTAGAANVEAVTPDLPQAAAYPMIRITPDKLELVHFDQDAVSVLVGNSKHLNVVLDTPRTAVLVPREPGSTSFTALNAKGEIIMERHVIIASPKKDYVRVRRSCANAESGKSCQEYSVFFCPDMCHKVAVQQDVDASRVVDVPDIAPSNIGSIPESDIPQVAAQDPNLPPPAPSEPPSNATPDSNNQLN